MIALHYGMIFAGMTLLAASLVPIRAILKTAGLGRLRQRWQALRALIVLFLLGYASYGYLHIGTVVGTADLIVSSILMAGGVFVLAVAQLSWTTTNGRSGALLEQKGWTQPIVRCARGPQSVGSLTLSIIASQWLRNVTSQNHRVSP